MTMNYKVLMDDKPFKLGEAVNKRGQLIEYYEHPTLGDSFPVIAVSHEFRLATATSFYDLEDLTNTDHYEYIPVVEFKMVNV